MDDTPIAEWPALGSTSEERGRVVRSITTACRSVADDVVFEGELHDYWEDDGDAPRVEDLHHYRVTIVAGGAELLIRRIEGEPVVLPFSDCPGAIEPLQELVGHSMQRGFLRRAEAALGSTAGCTHLLTLVRAMAATQIPAGYLTGRKVVEGRIPFEPPGFDALVDACRGWRDGGVAVELTRRGEPQPPRWRADGSASPTT